MLQTKFQMSDPHIGCKLGHEYSCITGITIMT
jgi:hypothetical protein